MVFEGIKIKWDHHSMLQINLVGCRFRKQDFKRARHSFMGQELMQTKCVSHGLDKALKPGLEALGLLMNYKIWYAWLETFSSPRNS